MVRRLARPAALLLVITCGILAMPPANFLEAVTDNLAALTGSPSTDRSSTEDDKTFLTVTRNAGLEPDDPSRALSGASALDVTPATRLDDVITPALLFTLSPRTNSDIVHGIFSFNSAVAVGIVDSDALRGGSVAAFGDRPLESSPRRAAPAIAAMSDPSMPSNDGTPSTGNAPISARPPTDSEAIMPPDTDPSPAQPEILMIVSPENTAASAVPEPASLTLMLGATGLLVTCALRRRRR